MIGVLPMDGVWPTAAVLVMAAVLTTVVLGALAQLSMDNCTRVGPSIDLKANERIWVSGYS